MEPDLTTLVTYDKNFPKKKKQLLDCQAEFEAAVVEIDTTVY